MEKTQGLLKKCERLRENGEELFPEKAGEELVTIREVAEKLGMKEGAVRMVIERLGLLPILKKKVIQKRTRYSCCNVPCYALTQEQVESVKERIIKSRGMSELRRDGVVNANLITTRELANTLQVDMGTIQRTARRLYGCTVVKVSTGGRPTYTFTPEQAQAIKDYIAGHHNLASRQIDGVTVKGELIAKAAKLQDAMSNDDLMVSALVGANKALLRLIGNKVAAEAKSIVEAKPTEAKAVELANKL